MRTFWHWYDIVIEEIASLVISLAVAKWGVILAVLLKFFSLE